MVIFKGYIYNTVSVNDLWFEYPPLESIDVVKEFLEVFPDYLPIIPLEQEINFGIDLLQDTRPISIHP